MEVPAARVWRDGAIVRLPAVELVPEDIIEVEAGDAVPADARLLDATDLAVEESALTGESVAATKDAHGAEQPGAALGDRLQSLFLGTTVVRGKARAVVTETGAKTELGKIGQLIAVASAGETPLERKLDVFGKHVLWTCLVVSAALFAWGLYRGGQAWPQLLLGAVSFAVAAIPEGLPAITTITLALGMQRMAKRGAIVRKLPAVETLGAATVICTDKTGTLTQNEMTVCQLVAGGVSFGVTGNGYAPTGDLIGEGGIPLRALPPNVEHLLTTAVLCNGAQLAEQKGSWTLVGDPTEGALLTLARKAGISREQLDQTHHVVRELPFDSNRKRMTVIATGPSGQSVAHVKGSADVILDRSIAQELPTGDSRPLTDADRQQILREADRMAGEALRVLAFAYRNAPDSGDPEAGLTFLGLVGMIDPPRQGVKEAIVACHAASIRAVMITGDHRLTATAIARELGLYQEGDLALTGPELAALSDEQLRDQVGKVTVFARTTPGQKLQIVKALKSAGQVVAMTGDGVNDAPALKEAHIGIAMGKSGTDVARQAADMVITDDNFATIVDAVREGRAIYRNIQKFIFFLLSSNAGLAVAVFGIALSRSWLPLTPLMILWINLVTNGFPALALGIDPPGSDQMHEPPRAADSSLVGIRDYLGILFVGVVMGAFTFCIYTSGSCESSSNGARTMAFTLLALSPLAHAWSCRSPRASIVQQRPVISWPLVIACIVSAAIQLLAVEVRPLRLVFHTDELHRNDWMMIALCAIAVVPAVELAKLGYRLLSRRHSKDLAISPQQGPLPAA